MFVKLEITGTLEVLTGMHIGGSSAFAAIGAVDSPVVRDTFSDQPMIPGSSLKGKMRALLAQKYNDRKHLPDSYSYSCEDDDPRILRLFGSAKKNQIQRSRVLFRDMMLSNMKELREYGLNSATEVKFENTISRMTAIANPRQIERVIPRTKFDLSIVYNVQEADEVIPDLQLLAEGMQLLGFDYLGGHGSRGYGKVKFSDLQLRPVVGEIDHDLLTQCQQVFEGV